EGQHQVVDRAVQRRCLERVELDPFLDSELEHGAAQERQLAQRVGVLRGELEQLAQIEAGPALRERAREIVQQCRGRITQGEGLRSRAPTLEQRIELRAQELR